MHADRLLLGLTSTQHGYATRRQLRDAGLTPRQIQRRLDTGVLRSVHRGLYLQAGVRPGYDGKVLAGLLVAGDGAASHGTAARLHGISGYERHARIDITVPRAVNVRYRGARFHRTDVLEPVDVQTSSSGVPVVRPERMIIGVAAQQPDRAGVIIDRTVLAGLATVDRVWRYLTRYSGPGCPGTAAVREALLRRHPQQRPPESQLEEEWIAALARHGVTGLIPQLPVATEDGTLRIDLGDPELMAGFEFDSRIWHSSEEDYRRERRKRYLLSKAGFRIFPVTEFDLHERAAAVASDFLAVRAEGPALS